MKTTLLTAALLTLSLVSYAQSSTFQLKQLSSVEEKSLNLKYLGKDSTSVLERIRQNSSDGKFPQKPLLSINTRPDAEVKQPQRKITMPTMQPDPKIQFPILAVKPDTAVRYHLQVKKPE